MIRAHVGRVLLILAAAGAIGVTTRAQQSLTPGAPFGVVETPAQGVFLASEVGVTGWALDDSGIAAVDVYRSPVAGEASVASSRRGVWATASFDHIDVR